jgi:amino acid adenylation domain-containing protein
MTVIDFGIKRPADFSSVADEILKKTIVWQFEQVVEKHPDRVAIKDSAHSLTYRELNNAINDLANQIISEPGENNSPVAFLFTNELFSIVAFLAILKSSRPFIGLHSGNSNEQIRAHLEDSTASLLITTKEFESTLKNMWGKQNPIRLLCFDKLQTNAIHQNPVHKIAPNDPFGIFYTSGSTGKPKGVMIGHLYVSQRLLYKINEWFISPSDRISLVTSVCYITAYYSVLGALLSGALLWIFDIKGNSAQKALDWIINEELTIFRCTPSIFRAIFDLAPKGLVFSKLRYISLSGEPSSSTDIELFKTHTTEDCVLINTFAATESGSICHYSVNHHTPSFNGFLPAGYPAPGKEVLVLGDTGQIMQNGEVGEIVVRSRFLSLGYWNQPKLTAHKFHADPQDPEVHTYYTGDRGRWREDGVLEILGRNDTQVKIRGYRIQLDAIDQAVRNLDGVIDAATIVHKSTNRGDRLVAYLSTSPNVKFSISQARNDLSSQLPKYMVPSAFVQLDGLPRTATGKLDRHNLPEPSNERPDLGTPYMAPKNKVEAQIASIWQDILELEKVGVEDNFFELGGDSLSALEMTLEVEKSLSKPVPQSFFRQPTVSYLAAQIEANPQTTSNPKKFVLENSPKDAHFPKEQESYTFKTKKIYKHYLPDSFDKLTDILVGRYIAAQSYKDAKAWIANWSQNLLVRNLFYKRRYVLFSKWMAELQDCQIQPSDAFPMSIVTNLSYEANKYISKKRKRNTDRGNRLDRLKKSPSRYWRSLAELVDTTPLEQLNENFPINGLNYVLDAYKAGKGVILLSFHGIMAPTRFLTLEKRIGMEIFTISYHIPLAQSRYHNTPKELPNSLGSTFNAEIALFGQQQLKQGKIINIVGDTSDPYGQAHQIILGRRTYQIKSGFAELAFNTGAKIIPHFGGSLAEGRPELNLLPPLDPGNGSRSEQIEKLIKDYTSFINYVWTTHPEFVSWEKIKKYFERPFVGK